VHGPLLPQNPWLADEVLRWGLARRGDDRPLEPLDDRAENLAAARAAGVARRERR
jgi:CobQ-like glutamine amidotransferase family enzyme